MTDFGTPRVAGEVELFLTSPQRVSQHRPLQRPAYATSAAGRRASRCLFAGRHQLPEACAAEHSA